MLYGEKVVRLKPLPLCSGTFHSISQPRKQTCAKTLVAFRHQAGPEKCCCPVDISWNYNLITLAHRHLNSQGLGFCERQPNVLWPVPEK